MLRNVIGSVLALVGAAAAVWSPFRAWYDGRHGRDYAIDDLFTGITDARAEVLGSILLPFALAALLTVVGVVLRSRLLVALAGVVVLGFTVLWMVRVGQAEGGLSVTGDGRGLGDGVANALGGGALLLLGALVMSGRRRSHRLEPRPAAPGRHPDDRGTGPSTGPGWEHGRGGGGSEWPDGRPQAEQGGHPGDVEGPRRHPQAPSAPYAAPTESYDVPPWGADPDRDRGQGPGGRDGSGGRDRSRDYPPAE
ncbi:hypothetical protein [Streptomyces sp. NPDC003327]